MLFCVPSDGAVKGGLVCELAAREDMNVNGHKSGQVGAYADGGVVDVLHEDTSALPRQLQSRGKQRCSIQLKTISYLYFSDHLS